MRTFIVKLIPARGAQRRLGWVVIADSFANGMYVPVSLLFYVQILNWPMLWVGSGLTAAGLLGLVVGVIVGRRADAAGPNRLAVGLAALEGVAMGMVPLLLLFPERSIVFLAVTLQALASQGSRTVRGVLIGRVGASDRVRLRAHLRALANVAVSVGSIAIGLVAYLDTALAYAVVLVTAAAAKLSTVATLRALPRFEPVGREVPGRATGLMDVRFPVVAATNAVMHLQYGVLTIALPVWITTRTEGPGWLVGLALGVNTLMVTGLQVWASKGVCEPMRSARVFRRAGAAFLLSCSLFAAASEFGPIVVTALVVGAVCIHTLGELWHAAAAFELPFGLAQEESLGVYQGVFEIGIGLAKATTPLVLALCIHHGHIGWAILGVAFLMVGLLSTRIVDWAARGHVCSADKEVRKV